MQLTEPLATAVHSTAQVGPADGSKPQFLAFQVSQRLVDGQIGDGRNRDFARAACRPMDR